MKVFWDTNLFIYLWEESPLQTIAQQFSRAIIEGGHSVITSSLTVGEILVQPARRGDAGIQEAYLSEFRTIPIISFDLAAAGEFAKLRARYHPALRPPDAIQLACAATAETDLFVTNDNRLSHLAVPGIARIAALADWQVALLE
ncbi:MAG TPA: type II toxin-antitoxin system VapC family toxin [Chthoniobacterales bacterium]